MEQPLDLLPQTLLVRLPLPRLPMPRPAVPVVLLAVHVALPAAARMVVGVVGARGTQRRLGHDVLAARRGATCAGAGSRDLGGCEAGGADVAGAAAARGVGFFARVRVALDAFADDFAVGVDGWVGADVAGAWGEVSRRKADLGGGVRDRIEGGRGAVKGSGVAWLGGSYLRDR